MWHRLLFCKKAPYSMKTFLICEYRSCFEVMMTSYGNLPVPFCRFCNVEWGAVYLCFMLLRQEVFVLPGESFVSLGLGTWNQQFSSQWMPFLASLFPWDVQHIQVQSSFYQFRSEMILFTSFAYLFTVLWYSLWK